jgi:ATP synthase subunit 6
MIVNNPLEQFKIIVLKYTNLFFIDITLTNTLLYFFLIFFFFLIIIFFNLKNIYLIPTNWQYFIELIYIFVLQIIRQQVSNLMVLKYYPLVLNIFIFILLLNLTGLLPYGFTITSQIIITFQIAISVFIGIIIIALYNNKFNFFKLFIPTNIPVFLVPFLTIIEFVSFCIRPFSLAVRLFANMLAGHTLLFIIASFSFFVISNYFSLFFLPLLFILFILILEICIAIVQAYVFCVLVSIYLNDIYNIGH